MFNNPLNPQNDDAQELEKIRNSLRDAIQDKSDKIDEFCNELYVLGTDNGYLEYTADQVSADLAPKMDAMHPKLEVVLNSIGVYVNARKALYDAENELNIPHSKE